MDTASQHGLGAVLPRPEHRRLVDEIELGWPQCIGVVAVLRSLKVSTRREGTNS